MISSENVEQQDLRRLVGTKSIGEDLSEQLERSLRTSSLVTEGTKSTEKSETISPGVELVNPEQICYKLILAPYDSSLLVVSRYESPNCATLGQNFLQRKIQDGRR